MSDVHDLRELRQIVMSQQDRIENLEKQVKLAYSIADAAEQYSRQDCLILRGKFEIRRNLTLREGVIQILQDHTGVTFQNWCVNTVHWLGETRNSVIIRFNNKAIREAIYRNRIHKDTTKRVLFIHEALTKSRQKVVTECVKLRREGIISTYYTQGGNIYVKKHKDAPSILLGEGVTAQDIVRLVQQQPDTYRQAAARNTQAGSLNQVQAQPDMTETDGSVLPQSQPHPEPSSETGQEQTNSPHTDTAGETAVQQLETSPDTAGETADKTQLETKQDKAVETAVKQQITDPDIVGDAAIAHPNTAHASQGTLLEIDPSPVGETTDKQLETMSETAAKTTDTGHEQTDDTPSVNGVGTAVDSEKSIDSTSPTKSKTNRRNRTKANKNTAKQ